MSRHIICPYKCWSCSFSVVVSFRLEIAHWDQTRRIWYVWVFWIYLSKKEPSIPNCHSLVFSITCLQDPLVSYTRICLDTFLVKLRSSRSMLSILYWQWFRFDLDWRIKYFETISRLPLSLSLPLSLFWYIIYQSHISTVSWKKHKPMPTVTKFML